LAEICPTEYRGLNYGVGCAIGRLGAVLAPFISTMLQNYDIYPQISFGLIALIGIFLTFCAEETFGKNLSGDEKKK
jgi:hypothetical protein